MNKYSNIFGQEAKLFMPRQNKAKIAKALFASSSILTLLAAASGAAYATGNG